MEEFYNAFISYGRADSKDFATKLHQKLTAQGLKIWFDQNDIPLAVDFQNQINDGIEKADNFLFIISPHAVNSPYCLKEIKLAVELHKRIIPLLHVEEINQETWQQRNPQGTVFDWENYQKQGLHSSFTNMHPAISKINWVYFREVIDDFETSSSGLISAIQKQQNYVKKHTQLLLEALDWQRNHKQNFYLLTGKLRKEAETWLKIKFKHDQAPCTPTNLQCEFITESIKNANNLMTQVFMSYSEKDRHIMEKIVCTFRREGLTIWTNKTDIKTGTDFQEEINKGIEGADNLVFLISPESLHSKYCQLELEHAFAHQKRIIPLLIQANDLLEPKPQSRRKRHSLARVYELTGETSFEAIKTKLEAIQFIDFTAHEDPEQYRISIDKLLNELKQEAQYYQQHKTLLVKALKWERQNKNSSILLRGYDLEKAQAWVKVAQLRKEHPPLDIHRKFIRESTQQPPNQVLEVFISYSRADSDFARQLNEALQMQGKTTWFDQESIASGTDFQQEIYQGIETANNFLFIISPDSINSPYCADEVEYAQKLNKRFVTILHRRVNPQDLHPALAKIQWIEFDKCEQDFYTNFSELVRTLDIDREHVRNHTKWLQRAKEWHEQNQDKDLLLWGNEFSLAENWLNLAQQENKQPQATDLHQAFIQASKQAIEKAAALEKQRQEEMLHLQQERAKEAEARLAEEKRRSRYQKFFLTSVTMALLIASGLGIAVFRQYRQAARNELKATITSSHAFFSSHQKLDALREAIRATKQLQNLGNADINTANQAESVLRQAVYGVQEYNRLLKHSDEVNAVAFSPDGQLIASASGDSTVKLWGLDGTLVTSLEGHSGPVTSVAFSPDSQKIASASWDHTVKIWQQEASEASTFWQIAATLQGHSARIRKVIFSSDSQLIASASDDKTIKIWTADGELLHTLREYTGELNSVAFSPGGMMIASAASGGIIKIWQREHKDPQSSWRITNTFKGHQGQVRTIAFSPQGNTLVSGWDDQTVKIWDLEGKLLHTLEGHSAEVYNVAFSPNGKVIASVSRDSTVRIWKHDGTPLHTLHGHTDRVLGVAFSPDSKMLASASWDNTVKIWKLHGTLLTTLRGHKAVVIGVDISPNGRMIASTSDDHTVKIWNPDGILLRTLGGHGAEVYGVAFSPDNKMLASVGADQNVKLWQWDGKLLRTLRGHRGQIWGIDFSPDGKLIASAGWDKTIKLWQLDGTLVRNLEGHQAPIWSLAFSSDSQMIASASGDRTVKLWHPDGTLLHTLKDHSEAVYGVAISPDNKMIASASGDHTIKLWRSDGILLHTLKGHENRVLRVAFSPDGQMLASTSSDRTVKLWQLAADRGPQLITTLNAHNARVWGVAFSSKGQMIASASGDKTVILWDLQRVLDLEHLLIYGCDWLQDYLTNNSDLDQSDKNLCHGITPVFSLVEGEGKK